MLGMICLMGFTGCSAQADKTGDALETDTEQNNAAQKEQETPRSRKHRRDKIPQQQKTHPQSLAQC